MSFASFIRHRHFRQGDIFCALTTGATLVVPPRVKLLQDLSEASVGKRRDAPPPTGMKVKLIGAFGFVFLDIFCFLLLQHILVNPF